MTKARCPNLYFTGDLRRRYGKTLGLIADSPTPELADDLAALGRVLLMYDASADLAEIKPIRPYRVQRSKYLRDALSVLRQANEPMTARAIARRVLEARGVPLIRGNLQRVECSLHAVLERLEGQGVVRVGDEPKRWALGSPSENSV
jgi:hypothetical protein